MQSIKRFQIDNNQESIMTALFKDIFPEISQLGLKLGFYVREIILAINYIMVNPNMENKFLCSIEGQLFIAYRLIPYLNSHI